MSQHKIPCKGCPFRKDTKPGNLGGSSPLVYIGQSILPWWLPCHSAYDATKNPKQQDPAACAQCAGAAIYRSNIGVADLLPRHLLTLPEDTDRVFAAPEEFLAHHAGLSSRESIQLLEKVTPLDLALREAAKMEVRGVLVKKGTVIGGAGD